MNTRTQMDLDELFALDREDICMMDDDELGHIVCLANDMLDSGDLDDDDAEDLYSLIRNLEDRLYNAW